VLFDMEMLGYRESPTLFWSLPEVEVSWSGNSSALSVSNGAAAAGRHRRSAATSATARCVPHAVEWTPGAKPKWYVTDGKKRRSTSRSE
jgi:hypothetical protein